MKVTKVERNALAVSRKTYGTWTNEFYVYISEEQRDLEYLNFKKESDEG